MRIAPLDPKLAWPLRQAILRPHQKVEEMAYPGDEAQGAGHFGAWVAGELVGVATVHPEACPRFEASAPWRIRGMAVRPESRGHGVGSALLAEAIAHARRLGARCLWCHARTDALSLYERQGFTRRSEPYELPNIGPHVLLALDL